MTEPRVPGSDAPGSALELTCGERVDVKDLHMGVREFDCECGGTHAVVQDVHPPSRFFPESLVGVLRETIEPEDDFDEFGTIHLMGVVLEEFPSDISVKDVSDDGSVGYSMVWVTAFDARRLHEIVVELVVELMEHAVSHADDQNAVQEFEQQMLEFDVAEFVEAYRAQRDFTDEHDTALCVRNRRRARRRALRAGAAPISLVSGRVNAPQPGRRFYCSRARASSCDSR